MPITFTPNLEQTFRANSFGTEKTHIKQLSVQLVASTAFKNPLATVLAALVTQIDVQIAALTTDIAVATAEATTAQGYIDGTLPAGWSGAGYDDDDMATVKVAINAYVTRATASKTNNTTFKNFLTQVDVDNFKLHNDLLCGLDDTPPPTIDKPTLRALMGLANGVSSFENSHGITFTNYLPGLFGALFTGDTTIAAAKAHMDTNPLPTTYDSLNIITLVNLNPSQNTPAALEQLIGGITFTTYDGLVDTHQAAFQTHITNDMAYYNTLVGKAKSYVQAYQVSGHIQDPFFRFMYTDVFGASTIQQTITDFADGTIT